MKWINMIFGIGTMFGGVYGLLVAYRVLPINREDSEKEELWHKRFGKMMKILSPIVILFGMLLLLGVL